MPPAPLHRFLRQHTLQLDVLRCSPAPASVLGSQVSTWLPTGCDYRFLLYSNVLNMGGSNLFALPYAGIAWTQPAHELCKTPLV